MREVDLDSTRSGTELQVRAWGTRVAEAPGEDRHLVHERQWRAICSAPCRVNAWVHAEYRIGGNAVNSSSFVLLPAPGPLVIHANAGAPSGQIGAIALDVAGGVSVLAGLYILMGNALACAVIRCDPSDANKALLEASPFVLGGIGLGVTGAFVNSANQTTLTFGRKATGRAPELDLGHGIALSARGLVF
jgi:hypothetical protein